MKLSNITIGADPELFIINETTKKVVSAIGLIPGKKGDPWVGPDMREGFGLETDNILAEFNIPPSILASQVIDNIEYMKAYIDRFVKQINPELGILCKASMEVDEDQLESDEAKEFGCSIDYNVYTEAPNPKPNGESTNLRSAGYHIHVGYRHPNIDDSLTLIRYLDMYVGVPSILKDSDTKRRSLYGKAGCFRLCPYGFEYRTLSSEMISNRENISFTLNQVMKALNAAREDYGLCDSDLIQEAINENNIALAKSIISNYNLILLCVVFLVL